MRVAAAVNPHLAHEVPTLGENRRRRPSKSLRRQATSRTFFFASALLCRGRRLRSAARSWVHLRCVAFPLFLPRPNWQNL
jgi:hypothetical protein